MAFILHSYVWHDSFKCLIRLIRMRNGMSLAEIRKRQTWLIHIAFVLHSHVWQDSFKCLTWLIHMRNGMSFVVTHEHRMWLIHFAFILHSCCIHIAFICVTLLVQMFEMTHSYMQLGEQAWVLQRHMSAGHDSCILHSYCIHMCDMTRSNVWHDSFMYSTAWAL